MPVQARGDKTPDLVKNYRAGNENSTDQSKLQVKKNPSW